VLGKVAGIRFGIAGSDPSRENGTAASAESVRIAIALTAFGFFRMLPGELIPSTYSQTQQRC
jgi:hypothetical protein